MLLIPCCQIAELNQLLADERKRREALDLERSMLAGQVGGWVIKPWVNSSPIIVLDDRSIDDDPRRPR
jgi:hypothetical protein